MHLQRLWLADFRSWTAAELAPAPEGITVLVGDNGEGKTNILEAVGYLSTMRSFRGAPGAALVRAGCASGVVRGSVERAGREVLVEAELRSTGRDRVQVNRQALARTRDLLDVLQVTVFAPDDLELVKGGPGARRDYLDDLLVGLHPRHDATRSELDRVLRQRNSLLKQAGGRATPDVVATLDVWDAKLAAAGAALVAAREGLVEALRPLVVDAYGEVAAAATSRGRASVALAYERSWASSLADALGASRSDDLRRGVSTVGPHRDELACTIGGLPARTHASQGEQRSLALALRLAGHRVLTRRLETPPVLLLDDVFSELDDERAAALVRALPAGQALLTTATDLPPGVVTAATVRVAGGTLSAAA